MTAGEQIDSFLRTQLRKIRLGQTVNLVNGTVYNFRTDAGRLVDKRAGYSENPDNRPFICYFPGKRSQGFDIGPIAETGYVNFQREYTVEGIIDCTNEGTAGEDLEADLCAILSSTPYFGGLLVSNPDSLETDINIVANGMEIFAIVSLKFNVIYTVPYGSE